MAVDGSEIMLYNSAISKYLSSLFHDMNCLFSECGRNSNHCLVLVVWDVIKTTLDNTEYTLKNIEYTHSFTL